MTKLFSKKGVLALLGTGLFILAAACGVDDRLGANPTATPNTNSSQDNGGNIPVNNPTDPTPTPGYPTQVVDAPIDGIEIITDPNDPSKYIVRVTSGLPSGCATFESYGFSQQGQVFHISVQNRVPADGAEIACTMIYGIVTTDIELGTVGDELEVCKLYTVKAGDLEEKFQAISPEVRCADPTPNDGGNGLISDVEALILSLKSMGIGATIASDSNSVELFGRRSTVLEINGQFVHVFEFSPGQSAHDAANGVSDDGTTIDNLDGTSMSILWVDEVRFYLFGNAILQYIGSDADVIHALDGVGTQFAGAGYEPLPDGELETVQEPAPVVSISDVRVMESFPPQYALTVRTAQPNGCATPGDVVVEQVGRTFNVTVYNRVPAHPEVVLCTMIYGETDVNVNLGSGLESGQQYTVIVNADESNKVTFVAQ